MKRIALAPLALIFCLFCAGCGTSSNTGGQLVINASAMPSGTVGTAYSYSVPASGGTPPYVWSLNSGTLPVGLKLSTKGAISGTPQSSGTTSFTLAVIDSEAIPASATANFSIGVQSELAVTSLSLPPATVGIGYSTSLAATGGTPPYTWTLPNSGLPPGLALDSNGAISGTPTTSGSFLFNVQVADSSSQTASGQLTIPVNTINITTQSLPAGTLNVPYSAALAAIGGAAPYHWTLSGALPAGLTLSTAGVISGTPTATSSSSFNVQVADSEQPPATASTQLSIAINGGGAISGGLQGNYAFYLNGSNSPGPWTLAGSFVADGNGNITSGVVDGNSVSGPVNAAITGTYTYTIPSSEFGTTTLQGPSWGPMTLAFVIDSTGNGRIIEYDDSTGQGSRGSGVLRKANAAVFSLGELTGSWAFGIAGAGASGERFVEAGEFATASGILSNGSCGINDGGDYQTCTFTGTLSAVNPQTGRATIAFETSNGASNFAAYVVSSSELVMEQIDPVGGGDPLVVGPALEQQGPFSNASLAGTVVLFMQDIHQQDGLDQSIAGLISFDGAGNLNITAMDEDLAGTITEDQTSQGTYSIDVNGAVTMACSNPNCPAGFLVSQDQGFFVGTGASSIFGVMEPQSGGPFSNASIAGSYAGGSLAPLDYLNAKNEVDLGTADGLGTLTVSGDASDASGLNQISDNVSYSVAANGRATMQGQSDPVPGVAYMISPARWVILYPSTDARMEVFQH